MHWLASVYAGALMAICYSRSWSLWGVSGVMGFLDGIAELGDYIVRAPKGPISQHPKI